MALNVEQEEAKLNEKTVKELATLYQELFGESTNSRSKPHLIKRILWRKQANEQGDISKRARDRAMSECDDLDIRAHAPKIPEKVEPVEIIREIKVARDPRLPMNGTKLKREYKGKTYFVTVSSDKEFEFDGKTYPSLSKIAKVITGNSWNGFTFFKLGKKSNQIKVEA